MLFADQRLHRLTIPVHDKDGKAVTIAYLIEHLCEHVMKDSRKELFVLDDHMCAPLSPPFLLPMSCSPGPHAGPLLCLHPREHHTERPPLTLQAVARASWS